MKTLRYRATRVNRVSLPSWGPSQPHRPAGVPADQIMSLALLGLGGQTAFTPTINHAVGAPPLRLTIDCSDERDVPFGSFFRSSDYGRNSRVDVESFCNLIHKVIPQAVRDGKFILSDEDSDQVGFSDTQMPMAIAPPKGFIPTLGLKKIKTPRLKIPKLNVPKLQEYGGVHKAPRVGTSMNITPLMLTENDESSAEKMEKLKKGIQKMLHFVKVLGKIDEYLSDRIRIVVDKMSKTFAE